MSYGTLDVAPEHKPFIYRECAVEEALTKLGAVAATTVESPRPLLQTSTRASDAGIRVVAFQNPDTGRYMNVLEGVDIELAPELISMLATKVEANRRNFPLENTLAGAFGLPGLYVRLDCFLTADGPIDHRRTWSSEELCRMAVFICEFDDQPAFVGSFLRGGHQSSFGRFAALADELAQFGRPLRLAEYEMDRAQEGYAGYPHDDRLWLPDARPEVSPQDVSVIVRARRSSSGSHEFIRRWEASSIFPGQRFRDYKGVLGIPKSYDQELGLGILVENEIVAQSVIRKAHSDGMGPIVAKGVYSARKEATMAIAPGPKVRSSYYRLNQLSRLRDGWKNGRPYRQPLVLQPAFSPPTLRNLGLAFTEFDRKAVATHSYSLQSVGQPGGDAVFKHPPGPGSEGDFFGLFRLYFIYFPGENGGLHKHARFAGGLLQATNTPMAIHGSNGAVTIWVKEG